MHNKSNSAFLTQRTNNSEPVALIITPVVLKKTTEFD